jgi:hypothetical protein
MASRAAEVEAVDRNRKVERLLAPLARRVQGVVVASPATTLFIGLPESRSTPTPVL